jgi:hypothetical protein
MTDNDMSSRQGAVIEFLVKEEIPAAEIHQRIQCVHGCEQCSKMGTQALKMSLGAVVLEQLQLYATRKEWMRSFKMTGV